MMKNSIKNLHANSAVSKWLLMISASMRESAPREPNTVSIVSLMYLSPSLRGIFELAKPELKTVMSVQNWLRLGILLLILFSAEKTKKSTEIKRFLIMGKNNQSIIRETIIYLMLKKISWLISLRKSRWISRKNNHRNTIFQLVTK